MDERVDGKRSTTKSGFHMYFNSTSWFWAASQDIGNFKQAEEPNTADA